MERYCVRCGEPFYAVEAWKRECFECWKARKNCEETAREKIARLERELANVRHQAPAASAIPQDLLRSMIQLCHPDRHGGKESAQRVTAWLLKQRTDR